MKRMFNLWLWIFAFSAVWAEKKEAEIPYNYFQYIESPLEQRMVYKIVVPPEIFDGCEAFPQDLQLTGGGRMAWPWVLDAPVPASNFTALSARELHAGALSNQVGGVFREIEVFASQLSSRGINHNHVTVRCRDAGPFRRPVKIWRRYKPDQEWGLVEEGVIVRFGAETRAGLQHLSYQPSRAPLLRIEVFPDPAISDDRVSLSGLSVGFADAGETAEAEWVSVPMDGFTGSWNGDTELVLDSGYRSRPIERLSFAVAKPIFTCAVIVSGRNSMSNGWEQVSEDVLYRLEGQEKLHLSLRDCAYRWLKLEIPGPDLPIQGIIASAVQRTIYFETFGHEKGLLRYGSDTRREKKVGASRRIQQVDLASVAPVTLGDRISVSTFVERKKWVKPWAYALGALFGGTIVLLIFMRRMLL